MQKIKKNKFIKKIFASKTGKVLKNTIIVRTIEQSAGDWRYPFIAFSWWFAKRIVPRRKVKIDGLTFTLSCTNWITHFRWFLFKIKEPEVRCFIDEYINDGDVFFDIGANVGVFSVYAAKRHPDISIFCFEPEISNLNALKNNIVSNSLTRRVKIYSVGIGNFVGLSELHLQDLTTGSAAHTESKEKITNTAEGYRVVWSEGIVSVTLDYICERLGVIPNVLKVDTDGNEDKILDGAKNTLLNQLLRSLVIEMPVGGKGEYCCNILKSAGFVRVWSDPDKTINEIWKRQ